MCISQTLLFDVVGRVPLLYRPNQVAEKVAARISENFSEAAIVMVKSISMQYMLISIKINLECLVMLVRSIIFAVIRNDSSKFRTAAFLAGVRKASLHCVVSLSRFKHSYVTFNETALSIVMRIKDNTLN